MGILDWFRKGGTAGGGGDDRFPSDMAELLATLGRRCVGRGGGPDHATEVAPFLGDLADDPEGFVDDLVRLGLRQGGWTAFGAQRWLRDVAPAGMSRAGATRMADVGVAWVVAQGYGSALDGWERQRAPGDAAL